MPDAGLGERLNQIQVWLDQNAGLDGWALTPSGRSPCGPLVGSAGVRGVVDDAIALYFADVTSRAPSSRGGAGHRGLRPSNPAVLLEICAAEGIAHQEAVYIGDSIARDVLMAKRAGVFAVWAAYGAEHSPTMYDALVRISHWTPEEVEQERRLRDEAKVISPDFIAHREFAEVLSVFGVTRQDP